METNDRASTRGYDIFKALISLGLLGAIAIMLLQGREPAPVATVPATATPAAATPAAATAVGLATPALNPPEVFSDGTVALSGTGAPGTNLAILANGQRLDTVQVGPDGTWSYEARLDPGDYTLSVQTLDADGNVVNEAAGMAASVPAPFAVPELQPPQVGADGQLSLQGVAEPGATVEVVAGDVSLGTAVAATDGTWSLAAKLDPGTYDLVVRTLDAEGNVVNESATATVQVPAAEVVEATAVAPEVPVPGATVELPEAPSAGTITLTGTGQPGARVEVLVDGVSAGLATVGGNRRWSLDVDVPAAGEYEIVLQTRDASGALLVESPPVALTVLAEAVAEARPAFEAVAEQRVLTLQGTGEPGAQVEIVAGDEVVGTTTVADDGTWTFTGEVAAEVEELVARFRDAAGQVIGETEPVSVADTLAAAAEVVAEALPAFEAAVREGVLELRGTGEPGAEVEIVADDEVVGTTTVADDGTWTFTGEVAAEVEELVARFRDAAGQVVGETEPVSVAEAIAPAAAAFEAVVEQRVLTLQGTGEPGARVEIVADDEVIGTTTVADDGTWTFTGEIAAAVEELVARFRNASGRILSETGPVKVAEAIAAATAAAVRALPALEAAVEQGVLTLRGTGEPGTEVEIVADDEVVGTTTVADDGTWTFTGEIAAQAEELVARLRDATGQVVGETEPVSLADALAAAVEAVAEALPAFEATVREGVLTLRGTGEPGAEVQIVADDEVVGTTTVADDGTWTFTGEIAAQAEELVARLRDATGQVVGETEPVSLADALAAAVEAVAEALPAFEAAVREGVLELRGTGEPGAEVQIVADDEVVGTTTVADDGTWTFTGEIAAEAEELVARLRDATGQVVGETEPVSLADALAAAAAAEALPALEAAVEQGVLTLRGTGQPGAEVQIVADDEVVGTTTVADDGTWTFTGEIAAQAEELVARLRDATGQVVGETEPVSLADALAATAAAAEVVPAFEAAVEQGVLTLRGTGEPGTQVDIVAGDEVVGTARVAADGTWTFTGEIAPGVEELVARFRNATGRILSETEPVSVADALAAVAAAAAARALPAFEAAVEQGALALRGTGEPGAEVEIVADGEVMGTATVAADGTWTFTTEIVGGIEELVARFRDAAGQVIRETEPVRIPVPGVPATGAAVPSVSTGRGAAPAPAAAPSRVTPSAQAPQGQVYIVRPGDWLSSIAERFYRNVRAYPRIVAATNLKAAEDPTFQVIINPDLIYVGQKLWLPVVTWSP